MIAQTNVDLAVVIPLMLGMTAIVCGVYVWVAAHIANRKKQPNAERVVYVDSCKESRQTITQKQEDAEKRIDERHTTSEIRANETHKELKDLIVANGKRN